MPVKVKLLGVSSFSDGTQDALLLRGELAGAQKGDDIGLNGSVEVDDLLMRVIVPARTDNTD
ncbi:hypothetical protein AB0I94_35075 [Streptomyces sp. NPDC050147]|uniref:hypothetical protein n=1 Tax=Streptomyces sp. NPDC050147 TaxID=3155513 RepID=UPI003416EF4A